MAKTLESVRNEVLGRLGDAQETIWSGTEVDVYLLEGYDLLAILTGCFFDQAYLEDRLTTANITAEWEKEFLPTGFLLTGVFSYTTVVDRDFAFPGTIDLGPTSLNHVWESAYLPTGMSYYKGTDTLPESCYQIERSTWNNQRLEPIASTEAEIYDSRYWIQNGEVIGYLMDKDGLRVFRKWRVPAVAADAYTTTGNFGILRDPSDISGDEVIGSWGCPRRLPGQGPIGDSGGWGIPRRCYQDIHNTRIEFSRRGRPIEDQDDTFELPDRYVKYVRNYALWKALERDGDGQDLEFAGHWKMRWDAGIARMLARKNKLAANQRKELQGRDLVVNRRPPLARLPWQYGKVVGYPRL